MNVERVVRFVFVVYCAAVGTMLVWIPWSPGWDRMVTHLPEALAVLRLPLLRSALSGFGLVHLVWFAHDVHRAMTGDGAHRAADDDRPGDQVRSFDNLRPR